MRRYLPALAASAALALLSACGDSDDDRPTVTVDNLGPGTHDVSTGDADAPTVGRYHSAADGSRLLVLDGANEQVVKIYRRAAGDEWVAVPAPSTDVQVRLLRSAVRPAATVDVGAVAGSYATQVSPGMVASFSLMADGRLVAGSSTCRLSGTVSASPWPGTLRLSLAASGCGSVPARSTGVLVVDADDAPARFRLVADNGSVAVDLRAFAE